MKSCFCFKALNLKEDVANYLNNFRGMGLEVVSTDEWVMPAGCVKSEIQPFQASSLITGNCEYFRINENNLYKTVASEGDV